VLHCLNICEGMFVQNLVEMKKIHTEMQMMPKEGTQHDTKQSQNREVKRSGWLSFSFGGNVGGRGVENVTVVKKCDFQDSRFEVLV
jgi:hypothetical protein